MMNTFSEQQLRAQALEAALRNGPVGGIPEVILDRAQKYYNFLKSVPEATPSATNICTQTDKAPAAEVKSLPSHYIVVEGRGTAGLQVLRDFATGRAATFRIHDVNGNIVTLKRETFKDLAVYGVTNL